MSSSDEIRAGIRGYLDAVDAHLATQSAEEKRDLLANLESHIHEALDARVDGEPTRADLDAVLAEMDLPESYGADRGGAPRPLSGARRPVPAAPRPANTKGPNQDVVLAVQVLVNGLLHVIVPIAFFLFMVFIVPRFEQMFSELDVQLPSAVVLMIGLCHSMQTGWPLFLIGGAVLLVADCVVLYLIARSVSRSLAAAWTGGVIGVQVLLLVACFLALYLPLRSLMNSMGG